MADFEVMAKDYIKFKFLNEVLSNKVALNVFLESEGVEKSFSDVRSDNSVYRFNNFNVSEDTVQNAVTFRPIVVGCSMYFKIVAKSTVQMDIIKNGTTTVAKEFSFQAGETKVDLISQGTQKYDVVVSSTKIETSESNIVTEAAGQTFNPMENPFGGGGFKEPEPTFVSESVVSSYDGTQGECVKQQEQLLQGNLRMESDIANLQNEVLQLEKKNRTLVNNKKYLIQQLDKLQAEYDKDYLSYESELEEIRSRYTVDKEIIGFYADKEVVAVEELMLRAENAMNEIEEQIKVFVTAQQKKTNDIESELKIGKKD